MPSWKKVIVSGSDAVLNSLNVTNGITGSLFGTASFAITASYVNPLSQTVAVSGALRLDPTQDPDLAGSDLDSTFLFQSSSNTTLGYDLYFRQNGNLVKWKWMEGMLESGLLYGGVVTYSGSDVFVSPGSGIIVDHNATTGSETSPIVDYVTWGPITQSIVNITSSQVTYLYIDDVGALQQQSTRFTSEQYHNYIPLGAVGHFDYTNVNAFGGAVRTSYDQVSQLSDFADAFGPLKVSGYGIIGQSGSLQISVASGRSFVHGGFYAENPEFPSNIDTNAQATASIAYLYRSGSGIEFDTNSGNLYTALRPGFYDNGTGTPAAVPGGSYTIQRIFSDPKTGVLYIYYGQNQYSSISQALTNLSTDSFTEGDTFDFTTFLGFIIVKGNTTDIINTSDAQIIPAGLFRGSGGGSGGGGGAETLDDLSDVSIVSAVNGQALVYDSGIWINSYPTSASFATTASYALSTDGFGETTKLFQTTASTTWSFSHNLGDQYPQIDIYSGENKIIIPSEIEAIDENNMLIYFASPQSGVAAASVGGTATTASYANTFTIETVTLKTDQNTDVDTGTEVISTVSTTFYDGAFFDYRIKSGSNLRVGTVTSVWDGTNIEFNDVSTNDIGNTSPVTMSVDISASFARLLATTSTDNWDIKTFVRMI